MRRSETTPEFTARCILWCDVMLKEVYKGIFFDTVITKKMGVQELNYCFIPGKDRSLLIDAGLPSTVSPACRETLVRDVEELGLDWKKLDCIVTHAHRDHVGQCAFLNEMGSRVFVNPADMQEPEDMVNHEVLHPDLRRALFHRFGIMLSAPEVFEEFWKAADIFTAGYEDNWKFDWEPLSPGETVEYGDFRFQTVALPGHTVGQMGLYEEEKKIFFSADQLVYGLSPLVTDTGHYPTALEDYMDSMRKIKHQFADCLFIPGHGEPFRHPEEEVDHVVGTYLDKCSIMFDVLRKSEKPLCVWGVSSRAYGRYKKQMTDMQRVGHILVLYKTNACLNYMKGRGLVTERMEDGVSMWEAASH